MNLPDLDDDLDLRAVMDRAVSPLHAPSTTGAAALASGRRLRNRRRVRLGGAGLVAAAAAVAVTVPMLGGSDPGSIAHDPPLAATPDGPAPSGPPESGVPSEAPRPDGWDDVNPPGWWDVPSTDLADLLPTLLPDGVTVTDTDTTIEGAGPGESSPGQGFLEGTLTTADGPGAFQLLLYPPATSFEERLRCSARYDSCEPIRDAAGDIVGRVMGDIERGTLLHEAFLLGPDGGALNFTVMNSTGEKPGDANPTTPVPPLDTDQLTGLIERPEWTAYRP